jgi:hypothetical protein
MIVKRRCFDCKKLFEQKVSAQLAQIVYRCAECAPPEAIRKEKAA